MSLEFKPGQRWSYPAPEGFEASRIIVGAVLSFEGHEPVVCCVVTDAPQRTPDGGVVQVTIPFLPLTSSALERSIAALDGEAEIPEGFARSYASWHDDPRGLSYFTVPFEGYLDRMIGLQMAAIVDA